MNLLVLRNGEDYFRFAEDGWTTCGLAKASVYPEEHAEAVCRLLDQVHDAGMRGAEIRRLVIVEEPYLP